MMISSVPSVGPSLRAKTVRVLEPSGVVVETRTRRIADTGGDGGNHNDDPVTRGRLFRLLAGLKRRHADLEIEIQHELMRPAPDAIRVQDLKLHKLRLKGQIAALTRR